MLKCDAQCVGELQHTKVEELLDCNLYIETLPIIKQEMALTKRSSRSKLNHRCIPNSISK